MASSAAGPTIPTAITPPSLLTLSAAVLSNIWETLPPKDIVRVLALVSKHPTLARFAHSEAPEEASLWTRLLRQCLALFTPARAWYGLREDDDTWKKPMSESYKKEAEEVERRLAAALEAAGLPGTEWVWEAEGLSHVNARKLLFVPESVPTGKSKADFLAWMTAFACARCKQDGTATAQCAACGNLLCTDCTNGCEKQDGCPFALCRGCKIRYKTNTFHVQTRMRRTKPGLVGPACHMCPTVLGCEAHIELGFMICVSCNEIRCMEHRCFAPGIGVCSCGRHPTCARPECRPPGCTYRMCQDCYLETCDRCEKKSGGRCQDCGGELFEWTDVDEYAASRSHKGKEGGGNDEEEDDD